MGCGASLVQVKPTDGEGAITTVDDAHCLRGEVEALRAENEALRKQLQGSRPDSPTIKVNGVTQGLDRKRPPSVDTRKGEILPGLAPLSPSTPMSPISPITRELAALSFSRCGVNRAKDENVELALEKFWRRLSGEDESGEIRVMRQSVFDGKWTLYQAGKGHKKPQQWATDRRGPRATEQPPHSKKCPFCVGNETKTPDPLLSFDDNCQPRLGPELPEDWRVRVFPNIFPLLVTPGELYGETFHQKLQNIPHSSVAAGRHGNDAIHSVSVSEFALGSRQEDAVGYSEVVVEDRMHNGQLSHATSEQVSLSLRSLQMRGQVLVRQPDVMHLMYFKQYGELSGGSLVHPHMQCVTLPLIPATMENRLRRAREFYDEFGLCSQCLCSLEQPLGDGPASSRLIKESRHFVAVVPFSSYHYRISIVPRQHRHSWLELSVEEIEELAWMLQLMMETLYHLLDDPSYNIYVASVDQPDSLGLTPPEAFHWSCEVHPRFPADIGGIQLATGIRVINGLPEDNARELRRVLEERLSLRGKDSSQTSTRTPPAKEEAENGSFGGEEEPVKSRTETFGGEGALDALIDELEPRWPPTDTMPPTMPALGTGG